MAKLYCGVGDYQPTTILRLEAASEQTNSRISVTCSSRVGDYQPTTIHRLEAASEQTNSRISVTCSLAGKHMEIYTRLYYIIMIEYQSPHSWVFINSIRSYQRLHDFPMVYV